MSVVWWEEPPKSRPSQHDWEAIANQLRQEPGRWALVLQASTGSLATTRAYQIRRGILVAFGPADSFEAKAYTAGGAKSVYARYVGPQKR